MQVSHTGTGAIAGTSAAFEFTAATAKAAAKLTSSKIASPVGGELLAAGAGGDSATLSAAATSAASLLSQALSGDASQPAKVEQIAVAVGNGSYRVDADRLTSTLMESMLQPSLD